MPANKLEPETDNQSDLLLRIAHKLEYFVILSLVVAVGFITLIAMARLGFGLYDTVFESRDPAKYHNIQLLFGMVMTVLIALELGNSILRHLREHTTIIQAREVILIGMLAVVRKVIIIDLNVASPWQLAALGVLIFSLAAGFWLMRDDA